MDMEREVLKPATEFMKENNIDTSCDTYPDSVKFFKLKEDLLDEKKGIKSN